MGQQLFQRVVDRLFHAPVPAALPIHRQHLADQKGRPDVIALPLRFTAGTDPAVLLLPGQDGVYVPFCPGLKLLILQKPGQRDEAVQPVGHPLPALPVSSDPSAVPDVRPDQVQMPGQAFRLQLQLLPQPPLGLDFRGFQISEFPFLHSYILSFR